MPFETLNDSEWASVDEVWERLESGEIEGAREALDRLRAARPGHPDVRIVEAALLLEEDDAEAALATLAGAERSADPALLFYLRALAAFDLVRFDSARADASRAIAIQPAFAEAHDLLSRVFEHLGDRDRAAIHADEARELDALKFPGPLDVSDEDFDAIVERSVAALPEKVRDELDEFPVLVQDLPSADLLKAGEPPFPPDILGLFAGRHLLERSHADLPSAPGAIYIFRRNLLRGCEDRDELEHEVKITVQHEVGHLLGLDEDDLERWGLA